MRGLIFLASWLVYPLLLMGSPEVPGEGSWDIDTLRAVPKMRWLGEGEPVRPLLYEGRGFRGKPTEVFAWYASPATLAGREVSSGERFPGIVLVHGGDGTAFKEWVELWARHGYAAMAMDLAGRRADILGADGKPQRLPNGGPEQSNVEKFQSIRTAQVDDDWTYHAVSNVILAHSLILGFPEVDKDKTALTGISWGGYVTCIAASLDGRFKAAVPVYGCGFFSEGGPWPAELGKLGEEGSRIWGQHYDPKAYLPECKVPLLFVSGSNDRFFPLNILVKSFFAVGETQKSLLIIPNMEHGNAPGRAVPEIQGFVDGWLDQGSSQLPKCQLPVVQENVVSADFEAVGNVARVDLYYALPEDALKGLWRAKQMTIEGGMAKVLLESPQKFEMFVTVTGENGMRASSPAIFPIPE